MQLDEIKSICSADKECDGFTHIKDSFVNGHILGGVTYGLCKKLYENCDKDIGNLPEQTQCSKAQKTVQATLVLKGEKNDTITFSICITLVCYRLEF